MTSMTRSLQVETPSEDVKYETWVSGSNLNAHLAPLSLKDRRHTLPAWSRCFTGSLAWRGWRFWSHMCRMMPLFSPCHRTASKWMWRWLMKEISKWQVKGRCHVKLRKVARASFVVFALWALAGGGVCAGLVFLHGAGLSILTLLKHCCSAELLISEVPSWKRATVMGAGSKWHTDF